RRLYRELATEPLRTAGGTGREEVAAVLAAAGSPSGGRRRVGRGRVRPAPLARLAPAQAQA
ncbi:MAG TPA: hypothetical protein VGE42_09715, partial [Candidatus Dormibacteraeota bacterium]